MTSRTTLLVCLVLVSAACGTPAHVPEAFDASSGNTAFDAGSRIDAGSEIDAGEAFDAGDDQDDNDNETLDASTPPPLDEPDGGEFPGQPGDEDAGVVIAPPTAPDAGSPPVTSCEPPAMDTTAGGGRCADLHEAWTARGINVGFYPYRVLAPIPQYSGDYTGDGSSTFTPGAASKGVLLQTIPAGAYVGVASNGPWYDPPTGCFPNGPGCGSASRAACHDSSPPRRPELAGFVWAYGYGGASAMQGWIPFDETKLEFAGFDPHHPCALGPAGCDFEVHSACGRPTQCTLTHGYCDPAHPDLGRRYCGECITQNRTCGGANRCSEGSDDCGATSCGAQAGGTLTPSAHRLTVTHPSAHTCSRSTPDPRVKCLANGSEPDFFFVYPFGAYVYWAQNSTTKHWLHYGDRVQAYFHNRDAQGVLWDFVEVLDSGAPTLTPESDGSGAPSGCTSSNPQNCTPCRHGGTCGWIQDVFLR